MASLDRYNDAAKVTARIAQALDAKVAAVKVHEFDLDVIEAARKVVGPQMPFVADCNNAHTLADVQGSLARWQALDLLWLEDPVWPPEALLEQPKLPRIVVGLGADLGSAEQLAVYAKAPVGVLQPDICMIGGVSETAARRGVARAAWRFDRAAYAVHRPGRARDPALPGDDERGRLLRRHRGRSRTWTCTATAASRAGSPSSTSRPLPASASIRIRHFSRDIACSYGLTLRPSIVS